MTAINELFREHVLRTRFELTLTRNQISVLVELDAFKRSTGPYPNWVHFHGLSGMSGLLRRGLVREVHWPMGDGNTYEITRAGELTLELLKEAGIYQHHLSEERPEQAR